MSEQSQLKHGKPGCWGKGTQKLGDLFSKVCGDRVPQKLYNQMAAWLFLSFIEESKVRDCLEDFFAGKSYSGLSQISGTMI